MEEKKIIQSSYLIKKNKRLYLEHRKLENFIEANEMSSYQLFLCGCHTLNIIINSIKNDYIIKDASAWNVVFYNGKPLFLDIGSFEKWDGNNTWIGYGQFIRHFITPLLINKELKIPTSKLFINYPDGIDPSTAFDLLGFRVLNH